jgi:NADP-dependent 3-hydroxy acid dehydrogenase YdfG
MIIVCANFLATRSVAQRSYWERVGLIAWRLAARIGASGGDAVYARTDVRRREDVSNIVGLAIERYGKLDVLVNNAGVAPISPLDELRVDDWEEMIDVNLKGVLYGIVTTTRPRRTGCSAKSRPRSRTLQPSAPILF